MSEPAGTPPTLRILPPDTDAPTPEQTSIDGEKQPEGGTVEVHDIKSDTDELLTNVLESKELYVWPEGSVVGDGTPGPGRRPLEIDERIVAAMAKVGGTNLEIAQHFGCSETVIQKRFQHVLRPARAGRKLRLRQAQYQMAMAGNVTMLIWLGKQELGQVDESRLRLGDLSRFSDEELVQIAAGKIPGQLGPGAEEGKTEGSE